MSRSQESRDGRAITELVEYATEHDLIPRWERRPVGDYQPWNVWLMDWRDNQVARGFGKSLSMATWRCQQNHEEQERARRRRRIRLLREASG